MKVIITGGEGFIGKALAATLEKRGIEVVSIDRRNGIEAGEYFANNDLSGIDGVYHLAVQTSVFNLNKNDVIRDNVELFKIVCDACSKHHVKLVYASSSTANPDNTTSIYGITKAFNEQYARCYNPQATGVRFHNVYGPNPRQGSQRVLAKSKRLSDNRKDKSGEKLAESEEDLLEHRTDGTDAFDTLCIGCEKFPYRDNFALPTSSIL